MLISKTIYADSTRLGALLIFLGLLWSCSGLEKELAHGPVKRYTPNAPLPDIAPIRPSPSVPLVARAKAQNDGEQVQNSQSAQVWLYASIASQAHLMTMGVDPTTGTRIWENYLRESKMPFTRVSTPANLAIVTKPGILILPGTMVLSDDEKNAILQWRNKGGAILSTRLTGTHSDSGQALGYGFMRDVLDVEVVGTTENEVDDTFMIVHGDSPISNSLPSGTRVWLERVQGQLPLRLAGKQMAAKVMSWSRGFEVQKPAGLISYNERKMPSGLHSRTVTLGYPEQNWQRSDPKLLKAISGDVFAWLQRQPRAYLGAWPYPYQSSFLLAILAGEVLNEVDVGIAKTIAEMGGRATFYIQSNTAAKAAPMIKSVQALGHEIGYFGDVFEEFKGQSVAKQTARFDTMQKQLSEAGISIPTPASFSAPMDAYDSKTLKLLKDRGFDNYLAVMDVSENRLPMLLVEADATGRPLAALPRTLSDPEESLEIDPTAGIENFLGGLAIANQMGALSVVRIPAQSLLMPAQRKQIFDRVQAEKGSMWIASARQISDWWRHREQVQLSFEQHPQGYLLSANVAQSVTTKEPISIWVNLPTSNSRVRLQSIVAPANNLNLPTIIPVDDWRSVLAWKAPAAGKHQWLLKFEEASSNVK